MRLLILLLSAITVTLNGCGHKGSLKSPSQIEADAEKKARKAEKAKEKKEETKEEDKKVEQ